MKLQKYLKPIFLSLFLGSCLSINANDSKGVIIALDNGNISGKSIKKETILIYPKGITKFNFKGSEQSDNANIIMDEKSGTLTVDSKNSSSYSFRVKSFSTPKNITGADSWSYSSSSRYITINKIGTKFSIKIDGLKGFTKNNDGFPLVSSSAVTPFYYDKSEAKVVGISLNALQKDVQEISGKKSAVTALSNWKNVKAPYAILAATANKSELGKILAKKMPELAKSLDGQWERFALVTVENPLPGVEKALVVLGSDRRGTAYGIFELSKLIGVSPLVWWADVKPQKRNEIYLGNIKYVSNTPNVKYRGIFLNDEDWGLQPWAAKNMDTDIKDIGPKTYAKIFELMLRMRANFIWTAMHPCTKAFYYYKDNPKIADDYAIVVGSSHCEPMLRNNVDEWKNNYKEEYGGKPGPWRYDTNSKDIYRYWNDRVQESANYESVYTVGMRGIHDGSMPGGKNEKDKIRLMDKVIVDQRKMLDKISNNNAAKIPQIFCPYKEVLKLYQKGIKLPDDVTLVWADDNHGYIRKVSNTKEQQRGGGSGIYYHLSYWGYPADYLWLSTTSPSLISYEMSKAYAYNARNLWVFNVGDIKPAEMEMEFSMALAWNVADWKPEDAFIYNYDWAVNTFGLEFAQDIAKIKKEYYRLASASRPEHSDRVTFTKQEIAKRLADYKKLGLLAKATEQKIPTRLKDAYFQLVLYPVLGCRLMAEKQLNASNMKSLDENSQEYIALKQRVESAYKEIKRLTKKYNIEISNGKWNKMMSYHPRNQNVFKMPKLSLTKNNITPNLKSAKYVYPMTFKNNILSGMSEESCNEKNGGSATITFESPKNQNQSLYALIKTPSDKEDSWFIRLNNYKTKVINEMNTKNQWKWVKLTSFRLTKGTNTLIISQREPNTQIKALVFGTPKEMIPKINSDIKKVYISSEKYVNKSDKIQLIRGISATSAGLTLSDINAKSASDNAITKQPKVVYNIPNGYESSNVELRFVPNHSINEEHKLRIAVQNVSNNWDIYNLNHKSKTAQWKENVLRGYSAVSFKIKDAKQLNIAFPDPGLILSEIVFSK